MLIPISLQPPPITPFEASGKPTDKKKALAQLVIDATTTEMFIDAKVTQTATEKYNAAGSRLADLQLQNDQIQAELAGLKVANLDLVRVREWVSTPELAAEF